MSVPSCETTALVRPRPVGWGVKQGAGQLECQALDDWTDEEQKQWEAGVLDAKWAVGQVTIRLPIRDPLQFMAILYGYLPFIIPIWWLIWTIETWVTEGRPRFFPAYGISIAVGFALVNETITKQICKRLLPKELTDRPAEAVCKHPGFPSGHVMNAYTIMIWCLLEVIFNKNTLHTDWLLIILVVMAPVPWARVYNRDHTIPQVSASALMSIVTGSIAFVIRVNHFPHHGQLWDWYSHDAAAMQPVQHSFPGTAL